MIAVLGFVEIIVDSLGHISTIMVTAGGAVKNIPLALFMHFMVNVPFLLFSGDFYIYYGGSILIFSGKKVFYPELVSVSFNLPLIEFDQIFRTGVNLEFDGIQSGLPMVRSCTAVASLLTVKAVHNGWMGPLFDTLLKFL